ncbi:MAG: glycine--tRNA ligase [Candidatus Micrarchaeaceae archaeon]|jgi:glycyl-tRNA synthetase|nr:glycine--tRNA ligase [Candidatus Micrarchaeota archaeon]HII09548.1 glycine--tRNA ligase [Candidatus Micrarchaeota archaeon]
MNIDDLAAFAKAKGFFWPTAEIYGGIAGLYDYGHLGALLKRRFEQAWLSYFVESNDDYYLIDGANMLPDKPLIASGHAERFNDVLVGCSKCHTYYRADVTLADSGVKVSEGAGPKEIDELMKKHSVKCPKDKSDFLPSKAFNMMIDVHLNPERTEKGYLRPETAQTAYLNFFREFNVLRKSLPMGLAIIGRAYRNEISPRQGLYRMRELIQAELQIFFDPAAFPTPFEKFRKREVNVVPYSTKKQVRISVEGLCKDYGIPEFYAYHMALIDTFYREVLGVPEEKIHFLEKGGDEKAFYNKIHMDIEVDVESWGGFKEVGGLHYRGDYDLTSHTKGSNQDLSVSIDGKRVMPNVLELSFGVDRNVWMLVDIFYKIDGERKMLMLKPYLAPFTAAIFPLQKDEKINEAAKALHNELKAKFRVFVDEGGSIGRRYARMDEIGTPYCITVDFESVDKKSENYNTVTVRERDTKEQKRIKIPELGKFLEGKIALGF